ncbi:type I 3-dehydroquinate dehydratase [Nanoarchaeota archaeon]
MKIAIPVIAKTLDGALFDMDCAAEEADIVELRIDFMKDVNLQRLVDHASYPLIVTNRTSKEGGMFEGPEKERIAALQMAIELGAEYVDIESDYFYDLKRGSTKLIVSKHNFNETPDLYTLHGEIIQKKPDIIKIATKANDYSDCMRMLKIINNVNRQIIGVCMGEAGPVTKEELKETEEMLNEMGHEKVAQRVHLLEEMNLGYAGLSRVLGPVCGSYLTFASLGQGKASAPGQISVEELKKAWDVLRVER